jgi:hypothetical protein
MLHSVLLLIFSLCHFVSSKAKRTVRSALRWAVLLELELELKDARESMESNWFRKGWD